MTCGGCWGRELPSSRPSSASPSKPPLADVETELSQEQRAALAKFRSLLGTQGAKAQSRDLLRFLRARRWDLAAAKEQYEATQRWRAEKDVDRYRRNARGPTGADAARDASSDPSLSVGGVECFPALRLAETQEGEGSWLYFGQTVFFGHDRQGRPIHLQRTGLASQRFVQMWEFSGCSAETIIAGYVRGQELQAARMEEASARLGRPVTKQVVIMDLAGMSYKPDPRSMAVFREFLTISARYYPETLGEQFFVNVPLVFMALWRVIKGWLDPVTAQKMHLLGADFKEELLKHVAPDQLPREYGGTNDLDVLWLDRDRAQTEALFASYKEASLGGRSSSRSVGGLSRRRAAGAAPQASASKEPGGSKTQASGQAWGDITLAVVLIAVACWLWSNLL